VNERISSVNVYIPLEAGQAFADIWRKAQVQIQRHTFLLDSRRWRRLHRIMLRAQGEWFVAATQKHCKVIWMRR
jgi:hypothetical protein